MGDWSLMCSGYMSVLRTLTSRCSRAQSHTRFHARRCPSMTDVLAITARDPYPFTGTNRSFSLMETATMATTNFHDSSVFDVPDVHLAAKLDIWTSPDLNLWSDGQFSDE